MFDRSVPVFVHYLKSLSAILSKGEAYCAARKIDPVVVLNTRLFPDMLPLVRQVQLASDASKGAGARLTGAAVPSFPDEERTLEETQARIARTIAFLESLNPEQFSGAAERTVSFKAGGQERTYTGTDYLELWAKPNFFFHVTTAYAILRHCGVELGKVDYLKGGN